ncbi:hypothetical protein E1258_15860 [Micromonospora sp. KC207]|uniref:hypothetical protein n=1 Tax=Micromonospora sp. KC207 TaxID=2530377 RepID=UPI001045BBE2|nr:hypothetical protein [Micromonospora sp. KC207]TDC60077.1 hypothetical protein E1258_15860 [Micromonospora sp. KC207]
MTSHGDGPSALFLTPPAANGLDEQGVTFDGSEEAMQRLRHPFTVSPADQAHRSTPATDDHPGQQH